MAKPKKDPRLALPGFEVYGELKPIIPFWQWLVTVLFLVVFGPASYRSVVPFSFDLLSIIILGFFVTSLVVLGALFYSRRWLQVGFRPEGNTLLMVGETISENLIPNTVVAPRGPVSIYVEKSAPRMQLRKMLLRFSTPEDTRRVLGWLDHRDTTTAEHSLCVEHEIWGLVTALAGEFPYVKRSRIDFERGICFVVDPGKNIFEVKPKQLERKDEVTLVAKTGFWHYGDVTIRFDSPSDADYTEQRLRLQFKKSNS